MAGLTARLISAVAFDCWQKQKNCSGKTRELNTRQKSSPPNRYNSSLANTLNETNEVVKGKNKWQIEALRLSLRTKNERETVNS